MSSVSVKTMIDAPPQKVWETIMDADRLGEWVSIHRSAKVRGDRWPREGGQIDQVLQLRGVSFKVRWTLDSVSPPQEAIWHGRGPALSQAMITYRLSGDPDGPTTFHYENEFHPPGGPLGAVAGRVFVGQAAEQEAQVSLRQLKQLLESS